MSLRPEGSSDRDRRPSVVYEEDIQVVLGSSSLTNRRPSFMTVRITDEDDSNDGGNKNASTSIEDEGGDEEQAVEEESVVANAEQQDEQDNVDAGLDSRRSSGGSCTCSRRSSRDSSEENSSCPHNLPSNPNSHCLRVPFGSFGCGANRCSNASGGNNSRKGRSASFVALVPTLEEDPRDVLRRRSLPRMRSTESEVILLFLKKK